VRRFKGRDLKIPHMGWNNIAGSSNQGPGSRLLNGVQKNPYMYFVHSYYVKPKDRSVVLTTTDYGIDFVSGVAKDNVFGLQFHPEKSQGVGLKILKNFVSM
jgi:glutamine amidotransferase